MGTPTTRQGPTTKSAGLQVECIRVGPVSAGRFLGETGTWGAILGYMRGRYVLIGRGCLSGGGRKYRQSAEGSR